MPCGACVAKDVQAGQCLLCLLHICHLPFCVCTGPFASEKRPAALPVYTFHALQVALTPPTCNLSGSGLPRARSQPNSQLYLMCCVSLPAMKQHTLFVWCVCLQHHCWGGVPGYGERDHMLLQGRAWHEFALNLGDCCSGRSSGRTK